MLMSEFLWYTVGGPTLIAWRICVLCAQCFTQPRDNPAVKVSLFPFYRWGIEAQRGGPLSQGPWSKTG